MNARERFTPPPLEGLGRAADQGWGEGAVRPEPLPATASLKGRGSLPLPTLAIDVHDLAKSFGPNKVVDGLSLQLPEGEICGFLGGNGSGKTTTIRMLCGLLRPDAGGGTCLGFDLLREPMRIREQIGYMTQRFSFYDDLTVAQNLEFVARLYQLPDRDRAIADVLQRMEMTGRASQLARELSGGWKQRLALAACVLHRPRLLLLDEPTAGVDARARREFWDLIHEMSADGMTVLVSTHYMDEAERCKRVVYLAGGKLVVQGTAAEVVHEAGLTVLQATGAGIEALVRRLRHTPGVETAAVFGDALRIAGKDRDALRAAVDGLPPPALNWQDVPPRLDDVFIHLLTEQETG